MSAEDLVRIRHMVEAACEALALPTVVLGRISSGTVWSSTRSSRWWVLRWRRNNRARNINLCREASHLPEQRYLSNNTHMKRILPLIALALSCSFGAFAADIVDTAVAAGNFTTLVTAVKAAGLVDTLKSAGPFTVFAPTDDAFKKLPAGTIEALLKDTDKLKGILTYHVVAGKVLAADVVKLKSAKTVEGQSVKISAKGGKVTVGAATVVKTDIICDNGVIHVIDAVLLPPVKK